MQLKTEEAKIKVEKVAKIKKKAKADAAVDVTAVLAQVFVTTNLK